MPPQGGYRRKYPTVEDLAEEFDKVIRDYTDELNYLHTRYIAEFLAEHPARYPMFNQIDSKAERTRKITLCFGERPDFELFHTTRQGNNGTVWRRIRSGEPGPVATVERGGEGGVPLLKICYDCRYGELCGGLNGDLEFVNGVPTLCWRFAPKDLIPVKGPG